MEGFIGIERRGLLDEHLSEVGEDTPVSVFIGVGQRAAGDGLTDAGVIKFGAQRLQTRFDVTQAVATSELGKGQDEELFVSGEFAAAEVAVVTSDTLVELVFGKEVQELGEESATFVHKVKNRRNAGNHPLRAVAELKSKNERTVKAC